MSELGSGMDELGIRRGDLRIGGGKLKSSTGEFGKQER